MTHSMPQPMIRRPLVRVLLVLVGLATVLLGALAGPAHRHLGPDTSGDTALAERVRAAIDDDAGYQSLVVAEVDGDRVSVAGLGDAGDGRTPDGTTPYETGSIAKTFVAAVFSDAIDRGEVAPDDRVEAHVPELAGTPAGAVTLQSLAQHTSGLPGLTPAVAIGGLGRTIINESPYGGVDTATVVDQARTTPVTTPGEQVYSNLGISLLGEALVRAAGATDWSTLVRERVFEPVEMTATAPVPTPTQVPAGAVTGHTENGRPAPRWYGTGYLPAGTSVITTADDLARYARALMADRVPGGTASMEPTLPDGENRAVGRVWVTSTRGEVDITWHNGRTGGFSTMLAMDREQGRAVIVLGNSTRSVDQLAFRLLTADDTIATGTPAPLMGWIVLGVAVLLNGAALVSAWRGAHRSTILGSLLGGLFGSVLALAWGPWSHVGGWAYGVALAPLVVGLALTALRWRDLPWGPPRRAWLSWTGTAFSAVLVGLALLVP